MKHITNWTIIEENQLMHLIEDKTNNSLKISKCLNKTKNAINLKIKKIISEIIINNPNFTVEEICYKYNICSIKMHEFIIENNRIEQNEKNNKIIILSKIYDILNKINDKIQ